MWTNCLVIDPMGGVRQELRHAPPKGTNHTAASIAVNNSSGSNSTAGSNRACCINPEQHQQHSHRKATRAFHSRKGTTACLWHITVNTRHTSDEEKAVYTTSAHSLQKAEIHGGSQIIPWYITVSSQPPSPTFVHHLHLAVANA
jgi:hypothetical protein